jgi:predicted glycogen debranching enzyme
MAMTPTDGTGSRLDDLLRREWLLTNHVGGYASSTVPSLNTRKYHGLLVAAMTPPVQRMVLLSRVEEVVHCDGWPTPLACNEYPGTIFPDGNESLRAFAAEPFPRWAYQGGSGGDGWTLEKSLQLIDGQNTVVLTYTLLGKKSVDLELRPLLALRSMHELTYQWNANGKLAAEEKSPGYLRVPPTARTPEVFFAHDGDTFDGTVGDEETPGTATWYFNTIYRREQERGYAGLEDLWSPGVVRWEKLKPGESVHFVCSADPIDLERTIELAESQCPRAPIALAPPGLAPRETDQDRLVRAAGAFVLSASPEQIEKTGVAMLTKIPWAPPNVRDALVALPGVLLVTGRFAEARAMLLGLAARVRNGLVPTEFPEKLSEPETFNGADTSLWFVNAVWQYLRYTGDEATVSKKMLDVVVQVVRTYHHGANAGITTDRDGLLNCAAPGQAMTWMDGRAGADVVTPRGGRPVEVNALWYNAVRIAATLCERFGQPSRARDLSLLADTIAIAFNRKFWNDREGCCFDVLSDHGPDPSVRPNQLLAISLPFPVLNGDRHAAVLDRVSVDLLTPLGPRTLSPRDPCYRGRYGGDVASRERAVHNGAVHPWLLGPFVSAYLRVHGRGEGARNEARHYLDACIARLADAAGCGQLCELFDGDAPHRPGGATASAPAVGELLRCYVEDVLDQQPKPLPTPLVAKPADVTVTVPTPRVGAK